MLLLLGAPEHKDVQIDVTWSLAIMSHPRWDMMLVDVVVILPDQCFLKLINLVGCH